MFSLNWFHMLSNGKFYRGGVNILNLASLGFLVLSLATVTYVTTNPNIRQLIGASAKNKNKNEPTAAQKFADSKIRQRERTGQCVGKYCLAEEVINNRNDPNNQAPEIKEITDTFDAALKGDATALATLKEKNVNLYNQVQEQLKVQESAPEETQTQIAPTTEVTSASSKNICLQDGGFWINNSCSYEQQSEAIRQLAPTVTTTVTPPTSGTFNTINFTECREQAGGKAFSFVNGKCTITPTTTASIPSEQTTAPITTLTSEQIITNKKPLGSGCSFPSECGSNICNRPAGASIVVLGKCESTPNFSSVTTTNITSGTIQATEDECGKLGQQFNLIATVQYSDGKCTSTLKETKPGDIANASQLTQLAQSGFVPSSSPEKTINLNLDNYAICGGNQTCNRAFANAYDLNEKIVESFEGYFASVNTNNTTYVWQREGFKSLEECNRSQSTFATNRQCGAIVLGPSNNNEVPNSLAINTPTIEEARVNPTTLMNGDLTLQLTSLRPTFNNASQFPIPESRPLAQDSPGGIFENFLGDLADAIDGLFNPTSQTEEQVLPQVKPDSPVANPNTAPGENVSNLTVTQDEPVEFTYYSQRDDRWADNELRGDATWEDAGCGIMVGAMVTDMDPYEYYELYNDYYNGGSPITANGSTFKSHRGVIESIGYEVVPISGSVADVKEQIKEYTDAGIPVWVSAEIWNGNAWIGHHTEAIGIDEDGDIIFNDPWYGQNVTIPDERIDQTITLFDGDQAWEIRAIIPPSDQ